MIGGARYFASRYFAPTYWPKVGDVIELVVNAVNAAITYLPIRRRRRNAF